MVWSQKELFYRSNFRVIHIELFVMTSGIFGFGKERIVPERIYNPITAMGFLECLPVSWTTLRDKHCRHPIFIMGVVDTFGQYVVPFPKFAFDL